MRRSAQLLCLVLLFSGVLATSAAAQTTVSATSAPLVAPEAGAIAGGADIGIFFPDEAFEKTITFEGFGEYYVKPNVSLRFLLGYASPGFENFTEDHFRQFKMLFNGVYYFKYNNLLPYVTGGAGVYFLRELFDAAPDPDSETRGGINFGFGSEFAIGRGATVKGELRWDVVSHPTGFSDATGMSLTFGYKRYF